MTYNLRLVQFETKDQLLLPGLLFEPKSNTCLPAGKSKKVLIYLHGNGSSSIFYSVNKMNILAEEFSNQGIAFFPFNNRGAHYLHTIKKTNPPVGGEIKIGMALEIIKDCIFDIDGAINFLKKLGYSEFYLAGSSTGANKIVVYHYYKSVNPIKKYILLSSGDDVGLSYEMLGRVKFWLMLKKCFWEIKRGNGRKLIKEIQDDFLYSYQSLYDTINPNGDYNIFPLNEYINKLKLSKKPLFKEYKTINKQTLVIYGECDEYCYGVVPKCVEILKKECGHKDKFTFKIIKGADHGFSGHESELAKTISQWLTK